MLLSEDKDRYILLPNKFRILVAKVVAGNSHQFNRVCATERDLESSENPDASSPPMSVEELSFSLLRICNLSNLVEIKIEQHNLLKIKIRPYP
jgi:hypothetical protein